MKRIVCLLLGLCLLGAALGGCGELPGAVSGEPAPVQTEAPPPAGAKVTLHLLLPPGQTELAEGLARLAAAEGITLVADPLPEGQSYDEALAAALAGDAGPDLFWVVGEEQAQALALATEETPFADLADPADPLAAAMAGLVPAPSRLLAPEAVFGLPVGFCADGTLVNIQLLADLLGTKDTQTLKTDLLDADLAQWEALAAAVAGFLDKPQKQEIRLGGHSYATPRYRPESAQPLRGIFAVATGDQRDYFKNTLGAVYGAAFASPAVLLEADAAARAAALADPMAAALQLLDVETQYMAGPSGRLQRGEGFTGQPALAADEARALFAEGRALFLKGTSALGLELEQQTPALNGKLALIPTKLPVRLRQEDGPAVRLARRFGYTQPGYLCLNAAAAQPEEAKTLLLRLFTSADGQVFVQDTLHLLPFTQPYPRDPLLAQLASALAAGDAYPIPAPAALLDSQQRKLGELAQLQLLEQPAWDQETLDTFLAAALGGITE